MPVHSILSPQLRSNKTLNRTNALDSLAEVFDLRHPFRAAEQCSQHHSPIVIAAIRRSVSSGDVSPFKTPENEHRLSLAILSVSDGDPEPLEQFVAEQTAIRRAEALRIWQDFALWGERSGAPEGLRTPDGVLFERQVIEFVTTGPNAVRGSFDRFTLGRDQHLTDPDQRLCDRVNDACRVANVASRLETVHATIMRELEKFGLAWIAIPGGFTTAHPTLKERHR